MTIPTDVYSILPIIVMLIWALVALMMDLWTPEDNKGQIALLSAAGLASGLFIELSASRYPVMGFNQMIVDDGVASFLTVLFCVTGIAGIALAHDYFKRMGNEHGEFYPLLMFSVCGMVLMAHANDLILIFLALELLSIPLYIMTGIARPQPES